MDEPRLGVAAVPSGDGVLGAPNLDARLDRWLADARSTDAAGARARARWLRVQAEESATFAGVLVDLAERNTTVVVHGPAGRRHRGVVVLVASDFCAVRTDAGRDVLIAYRGISSIRPDLRAETSLGDRSVRAELGFAEMLNIVAADRPRVLITTLVPSEGVAGELRSVGRDVVAIRTDGDARVPTYVPIEVIAEVTVV
ncbi:MAG TPA: hypothetical protein VFV00_05190 [Acidimicrobiales bacterium]|nr:hypothetical protein [Acidimicrobiales bacterium]